MQSRIRFIGTIDECIALQNLAFGIGISLEVEPLHQNLELSAVNQYLDIPSASDAPVWLTCQEIAHILSYHYGSDLNLQRLGKALSECGFKKKSIRLPHKKDAYKAYNVKIKN